MVTRECNLWEKVAIALFVVCLNFTSQISSFLNEKNRYFFLWEFKDGLALVLAVVFLALTAVLISVTLNRLQLKSLTWVLNHAFVLAFGSGLLSLVAGNVPKAWDWIMWEQLGWVGLVGVVGYSMGNPRFRLVNYSQRICLVFSPFVLILFYQTLTLASFGTETEPKPTFQVGNKEATPVLFFVFDEWSYDRSANNEGFLPFFPNLKDLAATSLNFLQARSPSSSTKVSLPSLIYQTSATGARDPKFRFWRSNGATLPYTKVPSLFQLARNYGYHTSLIGFYLPYRKILGDQVDYVHSLPYVPKGNNFIERMMIGTVRNFAFLSDPVSQALDTRLYARIYSKNWFKNNNRILEESLQLIRTCPNDTFAFFHLPLPHPPFIFQPDGTYWGSYFHLGGEKKGSLQDYERHLQYVDHVIGRIVETLKASGKFDQTLLIMTSDHSWNGDPQNGFQQLDTNLHVPLVVKLPGQRVGHKVKEQFSNNQLKPIIELAFRHDVNKKHVLELIRKLSSK